MRKTHPYRPLHPSAQWLQTVKHLLGDDVKARNAARVILWQQVQHYIEHLARLPIGPLNDDEDARKDIAVDVLKKLEANSFAHLAEWLARQLDQKDHASFWGLVRTIARTVAIDHARMSRQNIASRRDKRFQWVRVDCVDSLLLGEVLDSPRAFIECSSDQEIDELFARLQEALRDE
jgi:hypothetical protein